MNDVYLCFFDGKVFKIFNLASLKTPFCLGKVRQDIQLMYFKQEEQ